MLPVLLLLSNVGSAIVAGTESAARAVAAEAPDEPDLAAAKDEQEQPAARVDGRLHR